MHHLAEAFVCRVSGKQSHSTANKKFLQNSEFVPIVTQCGSKVKYILLVRNRIHSFIWRDQRRRSEKFEIWELKNSEAIGTGDFSIRPDNADWPPTAVH